MAKTYDLLIKARGETKDAERAMKQLQRSVDRTGQRMQNIGKTLSLAVTAPIVGLGVMGVREMDQIEQANSRTAASIKRLGAEGIVSVEGVQKLAGSLQDLSGQDDQVIQMGQNMLLTFGAINMQAKGGAKLFRDSSRVMVEFAEATNQSAETAGKQLAKSMASAANGVLLLPRGMKLGAEETTKLKKVLESSADPTRKQAALIEVLGKKVEGAAKLTNAEKWDVSMDRLAGSAAKLVTLLLPAFDVLVRGVERLTTWFDRLDGSAQRLVGAGLLAAAALGPLLIVVGSMVSAASALVPALMAISTPMLVTAGVVAGLSAAFVLAYTRSERFREIVNRSFRQVAAAVGQIVASMRATISQWVSWGAAIWSKWGDDIMGVVRPVFRILATVFTTQMGNLKDVALGVLALMRGDWSEAWDRIKSIVKRTLDAMKTIVSNAGTAIAGYVKIWAKGIAALGTTFYNAGKAIGGKVVDGVVDGVRHNSNQITSVMSALISGNANNVVAAASRSGRGVVGKGRSFATAGGVNVLGALFGSDVTAAQVLGYASSSTGQAFSVSSNEDGSQTVTENPVVTQFLKDRVKANTTALEARLATRKQKVERRAQLSAAYNKLKAEKAAAVRAKKAKVAADKGAAMSKNLAARATLTNEIEDLDIEIIALGGQIDSDTEALVPPEVASGSDGGAGSGGGASSGDSSTGGAGGVGSGGGSSSSGLPQLDMSNSFYNPLLPSSVSASGAVASAAGRALAGSGNVFHINSGDPEAVANRVAFILGGSILRAGGGGI